MQPALRHVLFGQSYLPESQKLFAQMTMAPDALRRRAIDNLIGSLSRLTLWQNLDLLYVMAAHDAQAARLNWKEPGAFTLTVSGAPTFVADQGYAGAAAAGHLDTGWDPTVNGSTFVQDSNHLGVWSLTDLQSALDVIGNDNSHLCPRNASDQLDFRAASATDLTHASASSLGYFVAGRLNTANARANINGVDQGATANASTGLTAASLIVCGRNGQADGSARRLAVAHAGGNLIPSQITLVYERLRTYLQAVGAV